MRHRPLLALLVCVSSLCAAPGSLAGEGAPPIPPAPALGEVLRTEVGAGGPVAILPWPDGLLAVSADGTRRRALTSTPTDWALVDGAADAIWFGHRAPPAAGSDDATDRLWVLDLRDPAAAPVLVLEVKGLDLTERFVVRHGKGQLLGSPDAGATVVDLSKPRPALDLEPGLAAEAGLIEEPEIRAMKRSVAKLRMKAPAVRLLTLLAKRVRAARTAAPAAAAPELPPVTVDTSACDDAELCGSAEPIPGAALQVVIVAQSCGDFCYLRRQLYDPAARRFVAPGQPAVTSATPFPEEAGHDLGPMWVAPDGSGFVSHGRVYRFAGGVVQPPIGADGEPVPARDGGWLGGSVRLN